ncbi:MAG: hypothetical protein H6Q32_549 [Bacteroidetes bacterium]|nr:hypothetical protein [Bacteroidota bacterium]
MSQGGDASECCPRLDPIPWDEKEHTWDNKRFVKTRVRTFLFMPLNFGSVMRKIMKVLEASGATLTDALCLSDHTSRWNMDVYLAVDREVKGAQNTTLSGKYYSKVYEGPFKDTGTWCKDFESHTKEKGLKIAKWFMWYTTCPKCAKKYGKNYVVIVAQV